MSNLLGGLRGTAYTGTNANQPPNLTYNDRSPNPFDTNYSVGDFWLYENAGELWVLMSLQNPDNGVNIGSYATWELVIPQTGGGGGASIFHTDAGDATEDANAITLSGGLNINTSGALHTVTINLDPNVSITGTFNAGGDIQSTGGSVRADDSLIAANGGLIVLAGGITSAGVTTLEDLGIGVVQSSAGGVLSSVNGTDGQLLIAGTGLIPAWASLTSGDNSILINPGPNTLDIRAVGGGGGGDSANVAFLAFQGVTTGPILGRGNAYQLGTAGAFTLANGGFDVNGDLTLGGAGIPLRFTAPVTGKYYLEMGWCIEKTTAGSVVNWEVQGIITNNTTPMVSTFSDNSQSTNGQPANRPGSPFLSGNLAAVRALNAGDVITFTLGVWGTDQFNVAVNAATFVTGFLINGNGQVGPGNARSAFNYLQGANTVNVTGNGEVYTLGTGAAFVPLFDVGNDVDGGGAGNPVEFTAPVTGKYYFEMIVEPIAPSTIYESVMQIITNSKTYTFQDTSQGSITSALTNNYTYSVVAAMTAGDTATFNIAIRQTTGMTTVSINGVDGITSVAGFLIQGPNNPSFIDLPDTTVDFGEGYIAFNGIKTIHNYTESVGPYNLFVGSEAGNANITNTGSANTALGTQSMQALTTGTSNIGIGYAALQALTTGINNTAVGNSSALQITTGERNTTVGAGAGSSWAVGTESNNVIFGTHPGITGDSNTTRIGGTATGVGANEQNRFFATGITGINVAGAAVIVSAGNQLGVIVSSARYKENIQPLSTNEVLQLNPVTFTYKAQGNEDFGLIAEDVAKILPEIVVYKDGEPETVQYHKLPVLLLDVLKKQDATIKELQWRIKNLEDKSKVL